MKYLLINSVCGIKSTGRICTDIAYELESKGHEVRIAYARENVPAKFKKYAVKIGSNLNCTIDAMISRVLDNQGLNSRRATKRFLKWADSYNPDVLWLHNIHGYYINYPLLFDWIKSRPNMKVKWTLHDCWAFTGHCSYFSAVKCNKWKIECSNCPQKKEYPTSFFFDRSKRNFFKKRDAFCGVQNLKLITPSKWMASLIKESILKEYEVKVHYNTVDNNIFKYRESDFRQKNGLENKRIILGVASPWSKRKGLGDFIELSNLLDERYVIVLVGLNDKQIASIPTNIIGIKKTNNAIELAEIYSVADVFVNPTYEDNYPTTNLEANACGTVTITYDTGGSVESVENSNVIPQGDVKALAKRIEEILKKKE